MDTQLLLATVLLALTEVDATLQTIFSIFPKGKISICIYGFFFVASMYSITKALLSAMSFSHAIKALSFLILTRGPYA